MLTNELKSQMEEAVNTLTGLARNMVKDGTQEARFCAGTLNQAVSTIQMRMDENWGVRLAIRPEAATVIPVEEVTEPEAQLDDSKKPAKKGK